MLTRHTQISSLPRSSKVNLMETLPAQSMHLRIKLFFIFWVWKYSKEFEDCFSCSGLYVYNVDNPSPPPRKELLLQVRSWPWEIKSIVPRLHTAWKDSRLSVLWGHAILPHSAPQGSSESKPGKPPPAEAGRRGSPFKQWDLPKRPR